MTPSILPERLPGEAPDRYLQRLKEFQSQESMVQEIEKEIARSHKRIRSEVEKAIIQREVRSALKLPSRSARFYQLPKQPERLLLFAPLYILCSIIWQNLTRTDAGIDKRYGLTENKDLK